MAKMKFGDIILPDGMIRGPFGSDMKKTLFVPESTDTVKVFTQENVFVERQEIGEYFISKEYYEKMSRFEVFDKDYLITCDGTLGKITYIKKVNRKAVINSSLLICSLFHCLISSTSFSKYGYAASRICFTN